MKSMDLSNLISAEQHFRSNGHDFNRDAKFTIIQIIEKDMNIKPITEWNKDQQINILQTYVRLEFNLKLNHLDLKWNLAVANIYINK